MTIGTGICGFLEWTPEEQAKADRVSEERREREAQEAADAAELEALYDKIEASIAPFVHDAAGVVNSATRIKPADRKVFEQFKKYCGEAWSPPLPALPAHPASVAAFLVSELDRGVAYFMKRLHALSRVHRSVGLKDPADDVLLKSLVLTVEQTEQKGSN
jgi:hypothetical protein